MPIRVLLANHHPIIRTGLRLLLDRDPEVCVVAEAANGREALILAEFKRPDVVILEVKLPQINGMHISRQLIDMQFCQKPMFVSSETEDGYVLEAFRLGARGFVAGDTAASELIPAIHEVAEGRFFLSSAIRENLSASARLPDCLGME
jgi:DNA-binding NarL/FixJ family response regulator